MAIEKLVKVILELVPKNSGGIGKAASDAASGAAAKPTASLASSISGIAAGATAATGAIAGLAYSIANLAGAANPYELQRFNDAVKDLTAVLGKELVPVLQGMTAAIRGTADDLKAGADKGGVAGLIGAYIKKGLEYSPFALAVEGAGRLVGQGSSWNPFGTNGANAGKSLGAGDFGPGRFSSLAGLGEDVQLRAFQGNNPAERTAEASEKIYRFITDKEGRTQNLDGSVRAIEGAN